MTSETAKPARNQETTDVKTMSKKERRLAKRAQRPNADLALELLHLWEELRPQATPKDKKEKLCDEIVRLSKDKIPELQRSHDLVRVFQTVLKHGQPRHRDAIYKAVIQDVVALSKSKFGHFLVRKVIKYGSVEQRCRIFQAFQPQVRRLLSHAHSAELLDYAFNEHADRKYRARLMQGLFGPYFLVFHDDALTSMKAALEKYPNKKFQILNYVLHTMQAVIKKKLHSGVFAQHVLFQLMDFYHECRPEDLEDESMEVDHEDDETEKKATSSKSVLPQTASEKGPTKNHVCRVRDELVDALVENVVPLVYTRDGVKCAQRLFAWCNAAQRKRLLRSLATFIPSLATHEHGFLLLLTVFECMDDVVSMKKLVLKELLESLEAVVSSLQGRYVLFHTLCGRDPAHFPPYVIDLLRPVADRCDNCKKPADVRMKEIRAIVAPQLVAFAKEHLDMLLKRNSTVLLLAEIILRSATVMEDNHHALDLVPLLSSLCQRLNEPFTPLDPKSDLAVKIAEATRLKRQWQDASDHQGKSFKKFKKQQNSTAIGEQQPKPVAYRLMPSQQEHKSEIEPMKEAPEEQDVDAQLHVIERAATHLLFRKLNQWDKERVQQHKPALFAPLVLQLVDKNRILSWLPNNRGCFFLVQLFEVGYPEVTKKLKSILEPVKSGKISTVSPTQGGQLLMKKLAS